jgi:hypothetical protein
MTVPPGRAPWVSGRRGAGNAARLERCDACGWRRPRPEDRERVRVPDEGG